MRMQASLLASAALTAEVDMLKQNLERSEQELGCWGYNYLRKPPRRGQVTQREAHLKPKTKM